MTDLSILSRHLGTFQILTEFYIAGNPRRTSFYPRGKGFGGSSLINTIAYTRGNKKDYDKWAELVNDPGWNYENLLPLFKKSENFKRTNPYVPIDEDFHGYKGPLHISQAAPPLDFAHTMLRAATQIGYNITDYNGRNQLGASIFQYFMKDGLRFDHEMAFLSPVKQRPNLEILGGSYVIKIDIDDKKKVKGVIFTRKHKTYIARNRKEVILSAGAICSPQILMLSGIGPKEHLESLGIPVVQDLPVGKTMYDHTMTVLTFTSNVTLETPTFRESLKQLLHGQGPLTRVLATDAVGFFKTPVEEIENYPDVEFFFANFTSFGILPKWFGFSQETADALAQNSSISFSISPYILHQKSFGTVTLKSADPFDYPLINPNILSDKENKDLETFYQAVQIILKLLETDTFRSMNVAFAVRQLPGCEHTQSMSREYWYCYFRRVSALLYHGSSTCMSGTSPKTAVVDNELNVFGIESLRVADASVIPFAVSGHTNAPCTVVGEKASEIIKQYYMSAVEFLPE